MEHTCLVGEIGNFEKDLHVVVAILGSYPSDLSNSTML